MSKAKKMCRQKPVSCGGISPSLLSLASLHLFPSLSDELPLRLLGCWKPLQIAQLIATHFPDKPIALISYDNPETGNVSSFVTQSDLKWWFLQGRSFEQIGNTEVSTGMILILVFSALIVLSASIAATGALVVVIRLFVTGLKKTTLRKLQQRNFSCDSNSRTWLLQAQISEIAIMKPDADAKDFSFLRRGLSSAAILVLFECLEHPTWQMQKDVILHMDNLNTRDVVREALIKDALRSFGSNQALTFPLPAIQGHDAEILRCMNFLSHENLDPGLNIGEQIQHFGPAELALKTMGARSCVRLILKHRNPEVGLAAAMVLLSCEDKTIDFCLTKAELKDMVLSFEALLRQVLDYGYYLAGPRGEDVLYALAKPFANAMLADTKGDFGSDFTDSSSAIASLADIKTAIMKSFLQGCLKALKDDKSYVRLPAAQFLGAFGKNQIAHLTKVLQVPGDEVLKDVTSWFKSIFSALCDALGENAFDSPFCALLVLDKSLLPKSASAQQVSSCPEFADSSPMPSMDFTVAIQQNYLQTLLQTLKKDDPQVRSQALDLLLTFATNQVQHLTNVLQVLGDEACMNAAKLLNDVTPWFKSIFSALCDALGDDEEYVGSGAFHSLQGINESLIPKGAHAQQVSSCPELAESLSPMPSLGSMRAAIQQNYLQSLLPILKKENPKVRSYGTRLLATFAKNQIAHPLDTLPIAETEGPMNATRLNDASSSFESVIAVLRDQLGDDDSKVSQSAMDAFESFWDAFEKPLDCPDSTLASPPVASICAMREILLQGCQQFFFKTLQSGRIGQEPVKLLQKAIESFTVAFQNPDTINLNGLLCWLQETLSALVETLGSKNSEVKRAVIESFGSCLVVLEQLDQSLMLKVANSQSGSDPPETTDSSSVIASLANMKASILQRCLHECCAALADKDWNVRFAATLVLGRFAASSVNSLTMAVQDPETATRLNKAFSSYETVISELVAKHFDVKTGGTKTSGSAWVALGLLNESALRKASGFDCPQLLNLTAAIASLANSKTSILGCCLPRCFAALKDDKTRQEAVGLLGTFAKNQIMSVTFELQLTEMEDGKTAEELNDVPSSFENVIATLRDNPEDDTVWEAFESCRKAFEQFDECWMLKATNAQCASHGGEPADPCSAIGSLANMKAWILQCCLQKCLAALEDKETENLIPDPDESAEYLGVHSRLSSFEFVISAFFDYSWAASARFWEAFESHDEGLMLEVTNVPCSSDRPRPLNGSSVLASLAAKKACMLQSCIKCCAALKDKDWDIREKAAEFIGKLAKNQAKFHIKTLQTIEIEACVHADKVNEVPSSFQYVISASCDALADEDVDVRKTAKEAVLSVLKVWERFDEDLKPNSSNARCGSESDERMDSSSNAVILECYAKVLQQKGVMTRLAAAVLLGAFASKARTVSDRLRVLSLIEFNFSVLAPSLKEEEDAKVRRAGIKVFRLLWHAFVKLDEDAKRKGTAEPSFCLAIASLKTQMMDSCLDGCMANLSHEDWEAQLGAAVLVGHFADHKMKSFTIVRQETETKQNVSAARSEFTLIETIISKMSSFAAKVPGDIDPEDKIAVIEAVGSCWDCLEAFFQHVTQKASNGEVWHNLEDSEIIDSLQKMKTVVLSGSEVEAHPRRKDFINLLENSLGDMNADVRWAAALELCKVGFPSAETMLLRFLIKNTDSRAKARLTQSTCVLAKSVASATGQSRRKRIDKALALFLQLIACSEVEVQKSGLEAIRTLGHEGLPVLVRFLECGGPEEQTAAAVGLFVVATNSISTCEPPATNTPELLQEFIEDKLYGRHSATHGERPTSLHEVQRKKNWRTISLRLMLDLPSPWTMVASAAAFVLFSSHHPLAELLSHPNAFVRSHHHRQWGFHMQGSSLLERGVESRHSWESYVKWFQGLLAWKLFTKCFHGTSGRKEEPFEQLLSLEEEQRLCAALQAFQLLTRFEVVPKSDLADPTSASIFGRFGVKVGRKGGQLALKSNGKRPRLLNVEAIERIVHRGFFPERYHHTSPVLHVLRPSWLLIDILVVLLQVAICILLMILPLAWFCAYELARVPFYPMSPVDSLTVVHFQERFAQLSERLLFTSPGLTCASAIYAAALFSSLLFAYCTESLPLAPFAILQMLVHGSKSNTVSEPKQGYRRKMAVVMKVTFHGVPWFAFFLFFVQACGCSALFLCWLGFGVVVEPVRFVPLVSALASFIFTVAGRVRNLLNWRRSIAKSLSEIFEGIAAVLWISLLERMDVDTQSASYQRLLQGIASDMDLFQLLAHGQQGLRRSCLQEFLRPVIDPQAFAMLTSEIQAEETAEG